MTGRMLSEASILFMRVEPSTLEGSAGHLCAFPSVNLLNCGNHDYMKHDTGWILCGSVHIYSFPHLLLSTEHQVCSDAWGLPLASQCPCQCLGTSRSFSGNSVDTLEFSIAGAHCQMPRNFKGRNLGCLVCLISCPCGATIRKEHLERILAVPIQKSKSHASFGWRAKYETSGDLYPAGAVVKIKVRVPSHVKKSATTGMETCKATWYACGWDCGWVARVS